MKYTVTDSPLKLKEMGRNIQSMVEYALTIENRAERCQVASQIVKVVMALNPGMKDNQEYKKKVWDSLFIMSDFKLDVDSPYSIPSQESLSKYYPRPSYNQGKPKFGQYGRNVEIILKQAAQMEDSERKWDIVFRVVEFMRACLIELKKEAYLENTISQHIKEITNGKLNIDPADLAAGAYQNTSRINRPKSRNNAPPQIERRGTNRNANRNKGNGGGSGGGNGGRGGFIKRKR